MELKQYSQEQIDEMTDKDILTIAQDRLIKAKVTMLTENPFWGVIATHLTLKHKSGLGTVATNGTSFIYDPEFILTSSSSDIMFYWQHEISHVIQNHINRQQERNIIVQAGGKGSKIYLFNIAADYAIHSLFNKCDIYFPSYALHDEKYNDLTSEEIYDILKKDLKENDADNSATGDDGDGGAGKVGDDNDDNSSGGGSDGSQESPFNINLKDQQISDSHEEWNEQEKTQEQIEKDMQKWKNIIASAASTAKKAGKMHAGLDDFIGAALESKLDWRSLLQRFISSKAMGDYSWSRFNKRYLSQNIFLPGIEGPHINVFVAIDTSGSVTDEEVIDLMGETEGSVKHLASYKMNVVYFDSTPYLEEEFDENSGFTIPKNLSRGGTCFHSVIKYMKEVMIPKHGTPEIVLLFTDGYDCWPEDGPGVPMIIISNGKTSDTPSYADVIKYDPDQ